MVAILLLFIGSMSLTADHDIHIGVCDIKIEDTSVEVTIKTFIDDLQIAVGLEPGQPVIG